MPSGNEVWIVLGLTQFYGREGKDGDDGEWGADSIRFVGDERDAALAYAHLCQAHDDYDARCLTYNKARENIRKEAFADLPSAPPYDRNQPSAEWQAHVVQYQACLAEFKRRVLEELGPDPEENRPTEISSRYKMIKVPVGASVLHPIADGLTE